jgi:hypothetical protein
MTKWADFGVFRVKYHPDRSAIAELELQADPGETFGSLQKASRLAVVGAIGRGRTFVTVYFRNGRWTKGEEVRVLMIRGQKFIRTDGVLVKADELGQLPEYS